MTDVGGDSGKSMHEDEQEIGCDLGKPPSLSCHHRCERR